MAQTSEKPKVWSDDDDVEDETTSITTIGEFVAAAASRIRDRATLTLVTGPQAGQVHTLATDEAVIGRARECAVRIDDTGISRRHARIVRSGAQEFLIEDLGSRNGTTLNGFAISRPMSLADGDRISLGPAINLRFGMTDAAEEGMLRQLYESSVTDGLTGVFNRKHFNERLAAELAYAKRHAAPLSLLIFDLDHFKRVNDTYGHLAGDQTLKSVSALIKRALRAEDVLARYGGEEFAIIARGIDVGHAALFAERLRTMVERIRVPHQGVEIAVTISIGVASLGCCTAGGSSEEIVHLADTRLYAAKTGGRNRTVGR